ncbi:MAG: copper chaperone PCu(A)C [Wenzhouxiangella sp.]
MLYQKTLAVLVLATLSLALAAADALEIRDAWSPEAPPARAMAGFMTLHNPGSETVVIKAAESDQFGRVEIHSMTMDDGVMRMRQLDGLPIPPGATIRLESGGIHLMLIRPLGHFTRGDEIEISLITEDDERLELISTVRPRQP